MSNTYLTILGLNYEQRVSTRYEEVKVLMRKALLKYTDFSLKDVNDLLKEYGIKDCNYFTILKAIGEVVEECEEENIPLNVDILDIHIRTNDLPF